jgi:hypothetical protein
MKIVIEDHVVARIIAALEVCSNTLRMHLPPEPKEALYDASTDKQRIPSDAPGSPDVPEVRVQLHGSTTSPELRQKDGSAQNDAGGTD